MEYSLQLALPAPSNYISALTCSDQAFGPISTCRFDFTLFFEQFFLSSLPAVILLLCSLPRLHHLLYEAPKVVNGLARKVKILLCIIYVIFQLALLVLWAEPAITRTRASIPSAIIGLLAAIQINVLSSLEHSRSIGPSSLIEAFLLFSTLLDLPQARTLVLLYRNDLVALTFLFVITVRFILLLVESANKKNCLVPEYQNLSTEESSGLISRSFLWWLNGLFSRGYRGILLPKDLYELDSELSAQRWRSPIQEAWKYNARRNRQFCLLLTLWQTLWRPLSHVVFPRFCLIVFTFLQPVLISRTLSLVSRTEKDSEYESYGLIAATGIVYGGIAVSSAVSGQKLNRVITIFRSATVTLIFEHSLLLEDENGRDNSAAMTLMSSDVDRLGQSLQQFNECWARSIELVIGLYLLSGQLGWLSVMPILVVVVASGISSVPTRLLGPRLKAYSDVTQQRMAVTATFLSDMKSVKMTNLSNLMGTIIQNERVNEIKKIQGFVWTIIWSNIAANSPFVLAPAATFAAYAVQAALHGTKFLDTNQAFTSMALISLVSNPAGRLLASIPALASCSGSILRVQEFLLQRKRVDQRISSKDRRDTEYSEETSMSAAMDNVRNSTSTSIRVYEIDPNVAVKIDNLTLRPARDAQIILRQSSLTILNGSLVAVTGVVGSGKSTLLRAILGEVPYEDGSIFVRTKYMSFCPQKPWFMNGTIREAVAGLGGKWDEAWYDTVIEACELAPDLEKAPHGDETIIGSRGIALSGGQKQRIALARALFVRPEIVVLDDAFSALDRKTGMSVREKVLGPNGLFRKLGTTVIMATNSADDLPMADNVIVLWTCDTSFKQGSFEELRRLNLVEAVEQESTEHQNHQYSSKTEVLLKEPLTSVDEDPGRVQDVSRQTGDLAVYKYYFKVGGYWKLLVFLFCVLLNAFSSSFSHILLKRWTDADGRNPALYIGFYLLLGLLFPISIGGYIWAMLLKIGTATGLRLHEVVLLTVLNAPYYFFTATDTGTLLNRFGNDMRILETQLPTALLMAISNFITILADSALVTLGSSFMAITLPFLMLAVFMLQKIYLKTSRQLRMLEMESRNPLYSHFIEILEGLVSIRAFGSERQFIDENAQRLNNAQNPAYLLASVQKWLALVLDLMTGGMAVTVISLALTLRYSTSPGALGVSLNSILAFNMSLSGFLRGWTMVETSIGVVHRIRDFEANTEVENKENENTVPPEDWPSQGLVEFHQVSAAYSPSVFALRDVSFEVLPGQRLCICGRTGSGKSTLISTILRLLDISSGTITIDSLDIACMPREVVRRRCTCLPQDALHLSGSLRRNADPFNTNSDSQIVDVLTKVGLWAILADRGGLNAEFLSDSLSRGQQQLLALARAILRRSRILILDEATSSVDTETERVMRRLIAEEFQRCTVIIVAHRTETIMDSDVVAVMEAGLIVEFGEPGRLMQQDGSKLRDLLRR